MAGHHYEGKASDKEASGTQLAARTKRLALEAAALEPIVRRRAHGW